MSVDLTGRLRELEREIQADRRLRVQRQLHPAARRCAVRQAGAAHRGPEKDAGRHLLHRGRCAGGLARPTRDHRADPGASPAQQAARAPTWTRCRAWSTRARAGCTPRSTRPAPRRAASARPTPTCKTSRSAPMWGARSAARSWPSRAGCCCRPTTRRWSCASWRTSRGDEYLLAAFGRGEDIHASAAAKVYGIPLNQVTKEQRSVAKMMNFATSYGVTAFGLAQRTGLSRGEADQFMQRYFATYPGVKRYIEETKQLRARAGLRRDAAGPAALLPGAEDAGHGPAGLQHPPGRRARGHQPSDPGHRGRHHQNRHDRGSSRAERGRFRSRLPSRCTMSWCWKCRGRVASAVSRLVRGDDGRRRTS